MQSNVDWQGNQGDERAALSEIYQRGRSALCDTLAFTLYCKA